MTTNTSPIWYRVIRVESGRGLRYRVSYDVYANSPIEAVDFLGREYVNGYDGLCPEWYVRMTYTANGPLTNIVPCDDASRVLIRRVVSL